MSDSGHGGPSAPVGADSSVAHRASRAQSGSGPQRWSSARAASETTYLSDSLQQRATSGASDERRVAETMACECRRLDQRTSRNFFMALRERGERGVTRGALPHAAAAAATRPTRRCAGPCQCRRAAQMAAQRGVAARQQRHREFGVRAGALERRSGGAERLTPSPTTTHLMDCISEKGGECQSWRTFGWLRSTAKSRRHRPLSRLQ